MAAITATAVSVAPALLHGGPLMACVSSSGAVHTFNPATSVWNVLPMVTT